MFYAIPLFSVLSEFVARCNLKCLLKIRTVLVSIYITEFSLKLMHLSKSIILFINK